MTLYKDSDNTLQHMPYRKSGNHQERIPWISAHPYDVKRGTFLGEMSRLATLSSLYEHYEDAMRSLVALYIARGYPTDEVHKWLWTNLDKRWTERLVERNNSTREGADVLVLKSQYNLAWNYFNATQLTDCIYGYWREWLIRADTGQFDSEFPMPDLNSMNDAQVSRFGALDAEFKERWDLRTTNIFNSRILVSRKRTRNFLDLTNLWKKTVLERLESQTMVDLTEAIHTAGRSFPSIKRPLDPDVNLLVTGRPLKRRRRSPTTIQQDGEESDDSTSSIVGMSRRYGSPGPSGPWNNASMGAWGRGARF
jgi:hypothetical protein